MPGGDGTGPTGKGPMTGRGAGTCGGKDDSGIERGIFRTRFGLGRGRARRNRFRGRGQTGRGLFGGGAAKNEDRETGRVP